MKNQSQSTNSFISTLDFLFLKIEKTKEQYMTEPDESKLPAIREHQDKLLDKFIEESDKIRSKEGIDTKTLEYIKSKMLAILDKD